MSPEVTPPGSPHLDADVCVDLVNGLLTPDEERGMLAHTAHCPDCEALLRATAATHERGRARAAEVLAGAGARGATPADATARPMTSNRRLWLAAAAVLLVVGGAWFLWGRFPPSTSGRQPVLVQLPAVDTTLLAVNRDGSMTDTLVLRGIEAYQGRDFVTARRLLAGTRTDSGMELMRRVFLANTQLELGQPESTLATLERVRPGQLPEPWRSESEWTRLVALSRTGRREGADSLLGLLAQGVGPVQDRARRLRAGNLPKP